MNTRLLAAACVLSGAILFIIAALFDQPPTWLAKYELIVFAIAALAYGFTGYLPPAARWLRCRPIRGAAFLVVGMLAMHFPPNLVLSCMFMGIGIRLVWRCACDLADGPQPASTSLVPVSAGDATPARS